MRNNFTKLISFFSILVLVVLYLHVSNIEKASDEPITDFWSTKKMKVKGGANDYAKPDGFIEYFNLTSKKIGQEKSSYAKAYTFKEHAKAKSLQSRGNSALDVQFISRGPGNVGGRTRAIAIDPEDASHCTWIAGAASGGLWKTTDCGQTWTNISPDLPNLSTNSIAQAASNPDVIYVGTGEVFGGNTTFVRGDGIFKSTDRGVSWEILPSTVDNTDYISVNRIAVDPTDENILVIATNTGIYRSVDGGVNWTETYAAPLRGWVQDLQVDPNNFNIQYAGVRENGVFKSTDAGITWTKSSDGISEGIRFELAVAPSNTDIVYASSYVGETTILYFSEDQGTNWIRVEDDSYDTNFLGAQGWYDNTVEVNPYNPYEVFVGGVSIGKYLVDPNNIGETVPSFKNVELENASFLAFISFNAQFNGGTLNIADGNVSPSENPVSVEIRWGGTQTQKAHRFLVPENGGTNSDGGAGIPTTEYVYQDYVDVPFEVWDIENNRQLMVSFRDQENDGVYNLNPRDDTNDPGLLTAREYLYIHDIAYDATTPNANVTDTPAGVQYANMYYFWPVLAEGATWDPSSYTDAIMRINYGVSVVAAASAQAVYDAYGNWEGQNQSTLHPDHHHLTFIKTNEANEEFMVINGNDGAFGFSTDNGVTFEERETGYVTSQFYGADKKPGEEVYIGGTQDNGTWVSSGATVNSNTAYTFEIGGDGFEVLWNSGNTNLVLGTIYNNRIYKSTNGGVSFNPSSSGIGDGDGPFITRLANSDDTPDVVYAIGASGVYKSTNFGSSWTLKVIDDETWGGNASASDVEVSLADANIVWAGAGMYGGLLNIFVSQDAGETYQAVNLPSFDPQSYSTGIYTHPTEPNTAYVLFSVADQAKILKTEDLGQTWVDISGFGASSPSSSNGFPDVFTHSLLVMPFNTDIIWAGTEIGIFESLDGGQSWSIRSDFPAASVWSMKAVDDEIVIGTHGRGIWSAKISDLTPTLLALTAFNYTNYGNATVSIDLPVVYDSLALLINDQLVTKQMDNTIGKTDLNIADFVFFDGAKITLTGYLNGQSFSTNFTTTKINVTPKILSVNSTVDQPNGPYPVELTMENNEPFEEVEVYLNDELVYTDSQELTQADANRVIQFNYDQENRRVSVKTVAKLLGNSYESVFSESIITSNKEHLNSTLVIYPNPVINNLLIKSDKGIKNVKVFSLSGKLIKKVDLTNVSTDLNFDMSSMKQGTYLIQIEGQNGSLITKRIIKK